MSGEEPKASKAGVAIVVLAAGRSSRMGREGYHKLLAEFDGIPLIRRSVMIGLKSRASTIVVVSGHERKKIESAIYGLPITIVFNPNFSHGLASSLVTACSEAAVRNSQGVLVMLADMPGLTAHHLDTLISAFQAEKGRSIVRAICGETPGNPVVIPHALLPMIMSLRGDAGARTLIEASKLPVLGVEIGPSALLDVDTFAQVAAAGGRFV
ncbi:nucleotidyltransferase family protein [Agrobacterium genomosp. 13]|uniref:nucleotidyltransferase family protein n=1 Tax=Agrobacterium genomosp. 13 TaxID=1183419 RepID=UPI0009BB55EF|nr:nucleotidyltransferase family protein [Agrobacterium genomosp. 13]